MFMQLKWANYVAFLLNLVLVLSTFNFKPFATSQEQAGESLVLVHVLFRHGNRTSQLDELYPKDPYLNFSYYPFGRGQLTNEGKRKEYSIGKALRGRYDKFLGAYYYPEQIEAVSTDYNRTKASLELVLASLFPPTGVEIWKFGYNWQPVPYNYAPRTRDKVLNSALCPNYVKKYAELVQTPKLQSEFDKHKDTFDYISENTGLNVTTYLDVYNLYFGLSTEEEYGLELPPWTKKVWPDTVTNLATKEYSVQTGTKDLRAIASGYLVQKIVNDTKTKIANIKQKNGRQIYLYSAHENNIAGLLIFLGVFDSPHVPTYGSYVSIEVHNINKTYGYKIYYQNYQTKNIRLIKLPDCGEFCPIEKFISLYKKYLPSDELCGF